jgi:hypothetical protein
MVNVSALFFVKGLQRADNGDLTLVGAVWDRINIYRNDPVDGGCQLVVLMQTDDPDEPNDVAIDVKTWRSDIPAPTVHETAFSLDPSVRGRNRYGVMVVPGAFFRDPGDYVLTAAPSNQAPTAYLRVQVVAAD